MPATRIAITRDVSESLAHCELTHLAREPIDVARAREQHAAYERALEALGCTLRRLPPEHELPDAVFVEDTVVVVPEIAVIARPGAESRRGEVASMEQALASLRPLARIEPPGTLDGGDVLVAGRDVFVGRSSRTNDAGREQLARVLTPFGYAVQGIALWDCLHLKSAATWTGGRTMLVNPEWVDPGAFGDYECIPVDATEPHAANALAIDGAVLHGAAFPRTRARIEAAGQRVIPVDLSELAKAEGAITCCCVVVESGD
jgi:dimethylargininase